MKWTHEQPMESGMYYINHPTIQQQILELVPTEFDHQEGDEVDWSWEDPNADEGYNMSEMPDDCLYAGPIPPAPKLEWDPTMDMSFDDFNAPSGS